MRLWIAVAILSMSALALIFATLIAPRPYRFLAGAEFWPELSRLRSVELNGKTTMARTSFIVDRKLSDFATSVQSELAPSDGWEWASTNLEWEHHYINDSSREWVSLYDASLVAPDLKGKTLVGVERQASVFDRLFLWANGRQGR